MREKVMLIGEPNSSKSWSLVNLAIIYPQKKVVIFDPDDGVPKVVEELGGQAVMPNLSVYKVLDWQPFIAKFKEVHAALHAGDWLCFDMLGRLWDLAQQYYSQYVFGEDPIEHLMGLKRQAARPLFEGFDGLTDWSIIKRLHNEQVLDYAILRGEYNIMATTSLREILPVEKRPIAGIESVYTKVFGFKAEGEKHNIHRFDGQFYLFRKADGKYYYRTIRDRGRTIDVQAEYEIVGDFWSSYATRVLGGI